jgi:hypothetical protein
VPQLLPQMVAGTRYRNKVAVATYFLIEVAAATSDNHAYRTILTMQELLGFAFGSVIGHSITIFGSRYHFRTSVYLSEFSNLP